MRNLIGRKAWDAFYASNARSRRSTSIAPYDIHVFDTHWIKFIRDNLSIPSERRGRFLEIGCGDGRLTSKIARLLGMTPFGIEFSFNAAVQARARGVTVACMDAFAIDHLTGRSSLFDCVFSYEFIEHFAPVWPAVQAHAQFARPGGLIVLQAPRLVGWNAARFRLLRRDLLAQHFTEVMERGRLRRIVQDEGLCVEACEYYGIVKFRTPVDVKHKLAGLNRLLSVLDVLLGLILRVLPMGSGLDSYLFSQNSVCTARA